VVAFAQPEVFDVCVALSDVDAFERRTFDLWTAQLAPRSSLECLYARDASITAARAQRMLGTATRARIDGATLAVLFGGSNDLARGAGLSCSVLAHPQRSVPKTMLVAISRPDHRSRTLAVASRLAAATGATLFGVHAVRSPAEAAVTGAAVAANARVASVGAARTRFEDVFVEVDADVGASVVRAAERVSADLVIVGRHSRRSKNARSLAADARFSTLAIADRSRAPSWLGALR
jgi:hypothetical protein